MSQGFGFNTHHRNADLRGMGEQQRIQELRNANDHELLFRIAHATSNMAHRMAPAERMDVQNLLRNNKGGGAITPGGYVTIKVDQPYNGIAMSVYSGTAGISLSGGTPGQLLCSQLFFEQLDYWIYPTQAPVYLPTAEVPAGGYVTVYNDPSSALNLVASLIFLRF